MGQSSYVFTYNCEENKAAKRGESDREPRTSGS